MVGVRQFLFGSGDQRGLLPVNKIVGNTVPIQHVNNVGSEPILKLPIVRKCMGYIADTINKADPQIVDENNEVIATRRSLPSWMAQPSAEYVFEEVMQQAVWSLFVNGWLRLLGTVKANGTPTFVYVGTTSMTTMLLQSGQLVYVDTPQYASSNEIIANRLAYRRRYALPAKPLGVGEFEPARTLLNTALNAQDALDRFFGSNMQLDLIFTHDGEYVENAGQQLLEELAKRHAGPRRAFRPMVTDRKWQVERLKDSNQSNQMMELYALLNTMISTQVFGIDPLVFSLSATPVSATSLTYQNASNLRSQVWQQAVEPVANLIAGTFTEYLPPGQFLTFSPTDFLRGSPSDRGQLVAQMALANKHAEKEIFSASEIREVLGYSGTGTGSAV